MRKFTNRLIAFLPSVLVFSAALALALPAQAQRKPLNMADIAALEKSQSWQELAQGLGDIAPAKRDKSWERIATLTATSLLSKAGASKQPGETFQMAENLLEQFPQLGKNRAFMDQRAEVGMAALKLCYQANSWWSGGCNPELIRFVERDAANDSLQFAAGKLVRLNNRHALAAPYFAKALAASSTPARCADEDVAMAVTSAMFLPSSDDFKAQVAAAQSIAGKFCSAQMRPVLLKQALESNSYFVANACATLKVLAPDEAATKKACPA